MMPVYRFSLLQAHTVSDANTTLNVLHKGQNKNSYRVLYNLLFYWNHFNEALAYIKRPLI